MSDKRIGTNINGITIVKHIADGAMGRVYEAMCNGEKRAIKVLHDEVAKDPVAVERFKREYETTEMLDHPGIVKVYQLGETGDGSHYILMELLQGEELSALLRRKGSLPLHEAIHILCQSATALEHAHSFGVVHRDLKPDNIFICNTPHENSVRLLDFGSVKLQMEMGPKLTAFGTTLGSPYYMSPEQAMGKSDLDPRSDIFTLGAIVLEMLTGKITFGGDNVAIILMKIIKDSAPLLSELDPKLPKKLDLPIDWALKKNKEERPGSVLEYAQAIVKALSSGLSCEAIASMSLTELESALQNTPPSPSLASPKQVASLPAPKAPSSHQSPPAGSSPSAAWKSEQSIYPTQKKSSNLGLWLGVAALLILAVAVYLFIK